MNKTKNLNIDWKLFYKSVFALVIPMALQNLINVGVTATDVIMLGKVGEKVLSGASLAGQVQFIMTLIFYGTTSGATVLTAQYWGKERHKNDRKDTWYRASYRTDNGGCICSGGTWHTGAADADLYF